MPAISFRSRFAPKVASGKKNKTIRAPRRKPIKPSDRLILYKNQRSPDNELLGVTFCTRVESVEIVRFSDPDRPDAVYIGGTEIDGDRLQTLAREDGFDSVTDFFDYFVFKRYGDRDNIFRGDIIHWQPLESKNDE